MTRAALPALDYAPVTPAHPTLVFVARCACAVLSLTAVLLLCGMIAIGTRGTSGGVYAAFLALQVALAVLLAFCAAYRPDAAHVGKFAGVALAAAAVLTATLATLVLRSDGVPRPLTLFRVGALASSVAAAACFALLRNRAATHAVLLQLAHRAVAVALWALVAKAVLTAWGRPLAAAGHLLPAAFTLFALAAVSALTVLYTSRDQPDAAPFAEARHLTKVSALFLAGTLAWMLLAALLH
jgi:hypothetical protein